MTGPVDGCAAPRVVPVDDPADPRLVEVAGLTDVAARARTDAAHGCFVVEGIRTLEAACRSSYPIRTVLVSDRKLDRVLRLLDGIDVDVHVADQALLEAVVGYPIHRGVVASAGRRPQPTVDALLERATRVVVAETMNDHENLGALFRNAAAFGIDGVLLDPTCADPLYRRSVRVSMGHVLRVPWTRTGPFPAAIEPVRDAGFVIAALTPAGRNTVEDIAGHERIAWLVGAEGAGLTPPSMATADVTVRIPMADGVDSLNVATAAAVAFALDPSSARSSGPRRSGGGQ